MIINTPRSDILSLGILGAILVGLVGCGSSVPATTPSAAIASSATSTSAAAPKTSAAASAAATPRPSPVVGGVCISAPLKFDPKAIDLTGAWAGDDGGIYYVRQLGSVVWWNGMSSRDGPPATLGRDWNNVGRGEINNDLTIVSDWVDVPRGGINGSGTVNFKIGADPLGNIQITKTSETGAGRGDTLWTRCTPGF